MPSLRPLALVRRHAGTLAAALPDALCNLPAPSCTLKPQPEAKPR